MKYAAVVSRPDPSGAGNPQVVGVVLVEVPDGPLAEGRALAEKVTARMLRPEESRVVAPVLTEVDALGRSVRVRSVLAPDAADQRRAPPVLRVEVDS